MELKHRLRIKLALVVTGLTLFSSLSFGVTDQDLTSKQESILRNLTHLYGKKIYNRYKIPLQMKIIGENEMSEFNSYTGFDYDSDGNVIQLDIKESEKSVAIGVSNMYSPLEFLFVACHEIGHGVAGGIKGLKLPREMTLDRKTYKNLLKVPRPYIEGEADYFAVNCTQEYLKLYQVETSIQDTFDTDVEEACLPAKKQKNCKKIFQAAKNSLGRDFKYESNNLEGVRTTLRDSYPDTECRLETVRRSYFNQKRPKCWRAPYMKDLFHRTLDKFGYYYPY